MCAIISKNAVYIKSAEFVIVSHQETQHLGIIRQRAVRMQSGFVQEVLHCGGLSECLLLALCLLTELILALEMLAVS